jgi:hypothetical protein
MNTTLTTVPPTLEFPPSPRLTHTLNTSGNLGMFVNPYTCSCSTCRTVIGEELETRPQSTGTLEASDAEELRPTATTYYVGPPVTPSLVEPTVPAAPPLVRVNAFTDALGRGSYTLTFPPSDTEADTLSRLATLRLRLKAKQDEVYDQDYRSHDEMAAADVEWEDLDNKIHAIEELLKAFGIAFEE